MYDRRNIEFRDNHVKFNPNFEFLDKLVKACNIKFHYNRPVTAEMTQGTDGQIWQKAIVDFFKHAKMANKFFSHVS
jgi:tellurite resistance protein